MKHLLVGFTLFGLGCGIDNELKDPELVEPFPPHTPPPQVDLEVEEVFLEPDPQPVDILFAIDKSCSMRDDELEINTNLPKFLELLADSNVDYHIGVISTSNQEDLGAGKLVSILNYNFISPQTSEPSMILGLMNKASSDQGGWEAGIDAVSAAIGPRLQRGENPGFFRHGVPLQIITISDEEDQSEFWTPKNLVLNLFHWMAENEAPVYYSAIVALPESECDGILSFDYSIGYRYLEVVERMNGNGLVIDICNEDWSGALDSIAQYATPDPIPEFFLKENPIEETIKVLVESGSITYDFDTDKARFYDSARNSVLIIHPDYEYSPSDVVKISYTVDTY